MKITLDEWPKLDPITNRSICSQCWNGRHKKKNAFDKIVDACDNADCDCVHLSEATWSAIERKSIRDARKEKRKLEADQLAAEDNPLRAMNPEFKKVYTGRQHA